ncbi:MAG: hypothetical protein CMH27_02745 [Micavibrio sp.]|nr:hypothetical protein [Micavibrio sp.]
MRHIFFAFFAVIFFLSLHEYAHAQDNAAYPKLAQIFAHVHDRNPSLKAAQEELSETRELYPQARAGWLPSLDAEASIFATTIENSNFSTGDGATTKNLSVNVNQPIIRGGRTFAETARARALIRAGEALLTQRMQEIYLQAAVAYADLYRDAEIWRLRQDNVDILAKELDAAQERYALGESTITGIHQAKVRYQRAQGALIEASADLESSEARFFEVAQMRPEGLFRPVYNVQFPDQLETIIQMAERQNPEIWIADYQQKAAEHNVDAVLRELFPQISAFANYNKQYDPQPGITEQSETQTIGLRATLALYQGGATRSRMREARRSAKRQWYEIQEIKNRIRQETTSNWHSYLAARRVTNSRQMEIESAVLALNGVREEARLGQRTILDILDADAELIEARIALANAQHDEVVSQFALAASLAMISPELSESAVSQ